MWAATEIIWFCKFDSGLLLPFRSQTLVNCTWLDSLRCVVYFYDRLWQGATSNHLERDKLWHVGCSYGYLSRPVESYNSKTLYDFNYDICYSNNDLMATSNKHYRKVFQFMILRIQVPECKKLSEYIFIIIGSLTAVGQIEAIKLYLIDRHSQFYLSTR